MPRHAESDIPFCFTFCFESFLLPAILASSSTRYLSVVVDDVIDYGS